MGPGSWNFIFPMDQSQQVILGMAFNFRKFCKRADIKDPLPTALQAAVGVGWGDQFLQC